MPWSLFQIAQICEKNLSTNLQKKVLIPYRISPPPPVQYSTVQYIYAWAHGIFACRRSSQNDLTHILNILFPYYLYLKSKMFNIADSYWHFCRTQTPPLKSYIHTVWSIKSFQYDRFILWTRYGKSNVQVLYVFLEFSDGIPKHTIICQLPNFGESEKFGHDPISRLAPCLKIYNKSMVIIN